MKVLSAFLILFCAYVFAEEEKCLDSVKSFLTCAKSQFNETEVDAIKDTVKSGTQKCFSDVGCTLPETKNVTSALKEHWDKVPEPVKKCLKEKFLEKVGEKFNECLSKKGIKNINLTAIANSLHSLGGDEFDGEHAMALHEAINAKITVAKGVATCAKDKFGDDPAKVKPLEQCLHDNKKSLKPKICAELKPCISNLSADCEKRGQEVHKAICECKKEKETEVAGKLATLGKQDKVSIKEIVRTILDDQEISDALKQVEACFSDNNEPEPPILKLVVAAFSNNSTSTANSNSTGPAALEISGKEVTILSDSIQLDASDASECEPCQ